MGKKGFTSTYGVPLRIMEEFLHALNILVVGIDYEYWLDPFHHGDLTAEDSYKKGRIIFDSELEEFFEDTEDVWIWELKYRFFDLSTVTI